MKRLSLILISWVLLNIASQLTLMAQNVPDVKLLVDAAEAVWNMADTDDGIAALEACGKWDPVLSDYARWRKDGNPDTRNQRSLDALNRLSTIVSALPDQDREDVRIATDRIDYLLAENVWNYVQRKDAIAIYERLVNLLNDCHSDEAANIRMLCRLALCFTKRLIGGDSPLFWDEVNSLEHELQEMLSSRHTEDIVLYRILDIFASVKSCPTSYVRYYNHIFNNEKLKSRGIPSDTHDVEIINSNSLWYINEAIRVYKNLKGYDPCNLAATIYTKAVYVYNNHLVSNYDDVINDIVIVQNHLDAIGKRGLSSAVFLGVWKSLFEIRLGRETTYNKDWQQGAELIKTDFGEDSEQFLDYLINLSTLYYNLKRYDELSAVEQYQSQYQDERKENSPENQLMSQIDVLWHVHANMSDTDFRNYVSTLVDSYLQNHRPTWAWIEAGKRLALRLSGEMLDQKTAQKVYEVVMEDTRHLLPPNHLQEAFEYTELMNFLDFNDPKYRDCLQSMEGIVNTNNVLDPLIARDMATYFLNIDDESKSIDLYRRAIAEAQKVGDRVTEAFCGIELALTVPSDKECSRLMDKYSKVMLQTDEYQWHIIGTIELAARYYSEHKDIDRSLSLYEKGRQLILKANIPQTTESCKFYKEYADAYAYFKTDYDASLRLLEELISLYSKGNFTDGYYADLFELQKHKLSILKLKGDGSDVIARRLLCINEMGTIAKRLLELSGGVSEIMFNYVLDVFLETHFVLAKYAQIKNLLKNVAVGTKQYEGLMASLNTFGQVVNFIDISKFEDLIRSIKEYDSNYLKNEKYYSLLSMYATYCYSIAEDTAKGDSILQLLLGEIKENIPTQYPDYLYTKISVLCESKRFAEAETYMREYDSLMSAAGTFESLENRIGNASMRYWIRHSLGRYEECISHAIENLSLMRELIDRNFDLLTQQERESILDVRGTGANYIAHLLEKCPTQLAASAYDAMLHEKNLLLRSSERIRRSVLQSGDAELISVLDSITYLQTLLRQNAGIGVESKSDEERMEYLALQQKIEDLERFVGRQSAKYRTNDRMKITWSDVKKNLKKNSAAIELIHSETLLGMLIISNELTEPVFVPLTEVRKLRHELDSLSLLPSQQYAEALYAEDKLHLYDRLWKPAERYLSNINTIYLSPTGMTNSIAFNAIKTPDGKALIDRYDIYQLTTTAFIASPETAIGTGTFETAIFGGILYDENQAADQGGRVASAQAHRGSRGAEAEAFCFLNGTISESRAVSEVMAQKGSSHFISGSDATEQTFVSLSEHSPSLIHLATHGFYIPTPEMVDEVAYLNRYPGSKYHSMQRCGLAFANANETWDGDTSREFSNDGILNANEIAVLDLSNTQLVTMSACETALGDYGIDGVYGLQRGLKQAGVRSIMASLWSVDDECTSVFMSDFYKSWIQGLSLHESLKEAVAKVRQEYASPYYWAAFILLDGLD